MIGRRSCYTGTTLTSSSAYTYYPNGNVATDTENTWKVTTYLYDDLGRLVSEAVTGTSNNGTITYTYDNRGNRLTQTRDGITVSYTYDLNNRLTTSTANGVTGYTYDANGNTLSVMGTSGSATYTYDLFNRQKTHTSGGVVTTTTYRPDGLRHSIGNTKHIWDGQNIVGEYVGSTYKKYFRALTLIYRLASNTKQWYNTNGHGDVIALTNTSGTVVKTYTYNAFGEEEDISSTDANPFRYCGEYYDTACGTLYLRARNYDASIGRFTQEDPIRDGGNWYSYCGSNPVNLIDPLGLFSWDKLFKGLSAVFVGVVAVAAVIATGGAATPLVAVGLAVTATAGTTSAIFGAYDIYESVTDKNPLKDAIGETTYETVELGTSMLASAGTGWIATNPQNFNKYYETENSISSNAVYSNDSKSTDKKPNQFHHFISNKNKQFTPEFEKITDRYGLDLNGQWNIELMPHSGRHPNAYHSFILKELLRINDIANGDVSIFLEEFAKIKEYIIANPDILYKAYWEDKMP